MGVPEVIAFNCWIDVLHKYVVMNVDLLPSFKCKSEHVNYRWIISPLANANQIRNICFAIVYSDPYFVPILQYSAAANYVKYSIFTFEYVYF